MWLVCWMNSKKVKSIWIGDIKGKVVGEGIGERRLGIDRLVRVW